MGSKFLSTVTKKIQDQLEMQNERWQSVENKLADKNAQMSNIESQISQFNQVNQTVSENSRNIDAINKQMKSLQLKIDDYDNNVLEYNNICDNVITANTELSTKVNDMLYRVSMVEDKVVDVQWPNMRESLIFTVSRNQSVSMMDMVKLNVRLRVCYKGVS